MPAKYSQTTDVVVRFLTKRARDDPVAYSKKLRQELVLAQKETKRGQHLSRQIYTAKSKDAQMTQTVTRRQNDLTKSTQKFHMEWLGVMFLGMSIKRMLGGYESELRTTLGTTDLVSNAIKDRLIPYMEQEGALIESLVDWLDKLRGNDEEGGDGLGGAIYMASRLGDVMSIGGQLGLGIFGLKETLKGFKGAWTWLIAGGTLATTTLLTLGIAAAYVKGKLDELQASQGKKSMETAIESGKPEAVTAEFLKGPGAITAFMDAMGLGEMAAEKGPFWSALYQAGRAIFMDIIGQRDIFSLANVPRFNQGGTTLNNNPSYTVNGGGNEEMLAELQRLADEQNLAINRMISGQGGT